MTNVERENNFILHGLATGGQQSVILKTLLSVNRGCNCEDATQWAFV